MNKVELVGNLCFDNNMKYSQGENATAVYRNTIACQRKFKNSDGNYESDFIRLVAFGKTAEFLNTYFNKGSKVGVTGRITTGEYTNQDGNKVYTTEVTVEDAEFVTSKADNQVANNAPKKPDDSFMSIPEGVEDQLPFE